MPYHKHECCSIPCAFAVLTFNAMPRPRSNRRAAQVAAAEAEADEWAILVASATVSECRHHLKVICLASDPDVSPEVELFCFTSSGQPLGTGTFMFEDSLESALPKFDPNATMHPVFEIVIEEHPDHAEGVVLGKGELHVGGDIGCA